MKKEKYISKRIGKNGDITFQVRIKDDHHSVVQSFSELKYGNAKTAYECAVKFRNKALVEIADNTLLLSSNITVRQVFEKYLDSSVLSCKTVGKHEMMFNKYIKRKDMPIQKITRADIIEDLNSMVDVTTDGVISRVLSIWKKDIVETALSHEYINKDLTLGIVAPKSHIYSVKKGTAVERDTIQLIENVLWSSDIYKYKIIYYLLEVMNYTGMRPAEVLVLRREDVQGNFILVTKELGSDKLKEDVVRRPKTPNSIRKIPIHPNLKKLLDELQDFALYDDLFVDENGRYMNSNDIGTLINRIARQHGVKFNMYMLRHKVATELVTNGVDQKTIMEILGHSKFDMSLYYANSNDELKEKAVQLFS